MNKRQKKKKIRIENRRLIKEFPFLYPRNVWTGKFIESYDYSYTWLDYMPVGWKKRFALELCRDLKEALIEAGYLNDYQIVQVKEKFGTLRWYDNGNSREGMDILSDYEYISGHTCAKCGALDVPMKDDGWVLPLCEKCYNLQVANGKIRYANKGYGYTYPAYKDIICNDSPLGNFHTSTRFSSEGKQTIERDITPILNRIQ